MKRVLDIGNCGPDHAALKHLVEGNFDAVLVQADKTEDALKKLVDGDGDFALILVNRKLDCDYSDGIEVIRTIKDDARFGNIPVMMITNFPEHQQAAQTIGAVAGFGKNDVSSPTTVDQLQAYLS